MDNPVRVQVCYGHPDGIVLRELSVESGTTLLEAVHRSGIPHVVPEIDLETASCGIHGKIKPLETIMRDGDRIEIYRPLLADPKEARRRRATKK